MGESGCSVNEKNGLGGPNAVLESGDGLVKALGINVTGVGGERSPKQL